MASPIERNKRHIIALNDLISEHRLTPMRLGLPIKPAYRNWILVCQECHISQRHIEEAIILKMEMFNRRLGECMSNATVADDVLSLTKICSAEIVMEFARKLVTFHRPAPFDYAAKFGIPRPNEIASPERVSRSRGWRRLQTADGAVAKSADGGTRTRTG
jgi:hypothetical protein